MPDDPPGGPIFEYKLNTEINTFEEELYRSAIEYGQNDELLEIEVGEWKAGLLNGRPIDRVGRPVRPDKGRRWAITLTYRQKDNPDISFSHADMAVSYIGGDHPLLLKVRPLDEVMAGPGASAFVLWFIGRCEQLWDGKEVEHTVAQPASPPELPISRPADVRRASPPELPISRPADVRKWKKVWRVARPQFQMGKSLSSISDWMLDMGHAEDLPYSTDTLRKIFEAGEVGLLD